MKKTKIVTAGKDHWIYSEKPQISFPKMLKKLGKSGAKKTKKR